MPPTEMILSPTMSDNTPDSPPSAKRAKRTKSIDAIKGDGEATDKTEPSRAPALSTAGLVSPSIAPTFTPAASTSQAITEALARRFKPEELCDRIQEGLDAVISITTKDGKVLMREDHSTRLRFLELVFAYQIGRPIERQMVINATPPATLDDLMEKARSSPVFRKTFLGLLQSMDDEETPAVPIL